MINEKWFRTEEEMFAYIKTQKEEMNTAYVAYPKQPMSRK